MFLYGLYETSALTSSFAKKGLVTDCVVGFNKQRGGVACSDAIAHTQPCIAFKHTFASRQGVNKMHSKNIDDNIDYNISLMSQLTDKNKQSM